jgi:hypothetical protein
MAGLCRFSDVVVVVLFERETPRNLRAVIEWRDVLDPADNLDTVKTAKMSGAQGAQGLVRVTLPGLHAINGVCRTVHVDEDLRRQDR